MPIRGGLAYPGGKWKALPLILPLIPDNVEDWREPFFGGGSVTLGFIQSAKARWCKRFLVGDLAPEIWAYWKGVQESAPEVVAIASEWFTKACPTQFELAKLTPADQPYEQVAEQAYKEGAAFFKWCETVDCGSLTLAQRAARTFLVNKISFSGMGDSGSMSKDRFSHFRLSNCTAMTDIQPILKHIEIINAPFQETMANVTDKSFVFLDPPYIAQEKSGLYGRGGDTHHGFPHQELADLCRSLVCPWLMTLDDSIAARKLYAGCNIQPFTIAYTMAVHNAADALAGEEIFIANYELGTDSSYDYADEIL